MKALLDSAAHLARQPNSRYDYTPILRTAISTGLRLGELLGLKWGDIDFDAGAMNVERQWTRSGELAPPKTAKGVRRVPLNAELVAFLRKHRVASKHSQDGDFVFASRAGTAPVTSERPAPWLRAGGGARRARGGSVSTICGTPSQHLRARGSPSQRRLEGHGPRERLHHARGLHAPLQPGRLMRRSASRWPER